MCFSVCPFRIESMSCSRGDGVRLMGGGSLRSDACNYIKGQRSKKLRFFLKIKLIT